MATVKDLVENPHPVYLNNFHYWDFLLTSYEGGIDYTKAEIKSGHHGMSNLLDWAFKIFAGGKELTPSVESNLFRHPKERSQDFADRIRMSYYYNFCNPIIDIFTNHLFKQPVIEDWANIEQAVGERSEDINLMGSSISEFRKEMADLSQIYGHIFVMTDSPKAFRDVVTQQNRIDQNLFPYHSFQHPQNVINWALDEFGEPYWVLIQEEGDSNIDPSQFDKDRSKNRRYRLWTRTDWALFDHQYKEIGRASHPLRKVPITPVYDKKSKKFTNFLGISFIADIAFIARDVYNSCSELKQILRDQTFAFLALQGRKSEYSEITLGTNKGLVYPQDRNKPEYVSPPGSNAEVYFKHIDRQVTKMFQLAKIEAGSVKPAEGQSAQMQSGVSKAWDFNQTNSALSQKAANYEDGEMKMWQNFSLWETGKDFEGSVTYPNEFSIQSLMQDLTEAEKLMKFNLGTMFNMQVKKDIIKKKFPRLPDEELEKMEEEAKVKEETDQATGKLSDRFPGLFGDRNRFNNANSGGNGGGV